MQSANNAIVTEPREADPLGSRYGLNVGLPLSVILKIAILWPLI
jgi:hypothetical protein